MIEASLTCLVLFMELKFKCLETTNCKLSIAPKLEFSGDVSGTERE